VAGGGYEFKRHFQIEVYYTYGKTSENDEDYKHQQFTVLLTGIAY
jgi:hypothetical protein